MSANINGKMTAICNKLTMLSSLKIFMQYIIHESYCSEKRRKLMSSDFSELVK